MSIKPFDTDILIAGGGTPGLLLACILGEKGIEVTVINPAPLPTLKDARPSGRTAALMKDSMTPLEATGAWTLCEDKGAALETLRIIDDSAGKNEKTVTADFNAREIRMDYFGINMPLCYLQAALAEKLKKIKSIKYIEDSLYDFLKDDTAIEARLESGKHIKARLLVGADGRHSVTRTLSRIDTREHDYGQDAITCLIEHSRPHDNISTEFHRPSGPFTLVPLPGNQSSVVWVDFKAEVESYMSLSRHAFEHALQDRTRDVLGKVTLATEPEATALRGLKAKRLTAPRVALIAEAAHVLHPLGAQGLNLSIRDVICLSDIVIDTMSLGLDPGTQTTLRRYERARQPDIAMRFWGTDSLTRLVSRKSPLIGSLRKAGLKTLSKASPLKELVMQEGMAPATHARGKAAV